MVPSLLLRADASAAIGLGHAMRLLALAQAYRDMGGAVHWAFCELPGSVQHRLSAEGITLHRFDAPPASLEDAQATARIAKAIAAPWVVIDGYQFTPSYRRTLKAAGVFLVALDDLGRQPLFDADIVVNHNIYAETLAYRVNPGTRLLLGPRYVLLRREFRSLRATSRPVTSPVRRILLTLGGSDPSNTTALALQALKTMPLSDTTIDVVIGGANPHRNTLEQFAEQAQHKIRLHYNVQDMPSLMATADLALCAAGTTALELAFAGVPAILCATADNQEAALRAFQEQGAALSIGLAESLTVDTIRTALLQLIHDEVLRHTLSSRARALVDGEGAGRVLHAMFTRLTSHE